MGQSGRREERLPARQATPALREIRKGRRRFIGLGLGLAECGLQEGVRGWRGCGGTSHRKGSGSSRNGAIQGEGRRRT